MGSVWLPIPYSIFLLASYVSMVFVWMMTDVSAFCQYSLFVVIVRVTLQELNPKAAPSAVSAAISTEITILMICCFVIVYLLPSP